MVNYNAYQQPTMAISGQQQFQQSNSNIYWVQGIEGAKAYPIAPGTNVALWDSEAQCIYIKMADVSGVPQPLRVLDYTERRITQEVPAQQNYITAEQLNNILDEKLAALTQQIQPKQNNRYNKKGGERNG